MDLWTPFQIPQLPGSAHVPPCSNTSHGSLVPCRRAQPSRSIGAHPAFLPPPHTQNKPPATRLSGRFPSPEMPPSPTAISWCWSLSILPGLAQMPPSHRAPGAASCSVSIGQRIRASTLLLALPSGSRRPARPQDAKAGQSASHAARLVSTRCGAGARNPRLRDAAAQGITHSQTAKPDATALPLRSRGLALTCHATLVTSLQPHTATAPLWASVSLSMRR